MSRIKKPVTAIDARQETSGFMQFFKKELEQIYMLELKSNEMIRKLVGTALYAPLKKAMQNYLIESNGHINCLRGFGMKTNMVSFENRKTTELLIHPLFLELDTIGNGTRLKEIALVTGIQKILFYEMAIYRSLCTAARKIYNFEWADAFNGILKEKKMNDSILSEIALSGMYNAAIRE